MTIHDRARIRQEASASLGNYRREAGRLIAYYAGIIGLLSIVSMVLSYSLDSRIAGTGGLGQLGLRSVLSTAQTILPLAQTLILSCLGIGYHIAMLRVVRSQSPSPSNLKEGFRRFGPMLGASLLRGLIYAGMGIAAVYLGTILFMMTPLSKPFYAVMGPYLQNVSPLDGGAALDVDILNAAVPTVMPVLWLSGILAVVFITPAAYRYRMVDFCLAEDFRVGAMAAMRRSVSLMRRNRIALFRLDLQFWWYYLLLAASSVLFYGDLLLDLMGMPAVLPPDAGYLVFGLLGVGAQFAVQFFFMNRVTATYAVAYETLQEKIKNEG